MTPVEAKLVALLRGPKLSDLKTREALGISHDECIRLHHDLRTKLGVNIHRESLRDFVRRHHEI